MLFETLLLKLGNLLRQPQQPQQKNHNNENHNKDDHNKDNYNKEVHEKTTPIKTLNIVRTFLELMIFPYAGSFDQLKHITIRCMSPLFTIFVCL